MIIGLDQSMVEQRCLRAVLLELYKSDKSPSVYCLFILFFCNSVPVSKGGSAEIF